MGPLFVAVATALVWLPILLRFFRSWRERNNPISLAIFVLVLLAVYTPIYAAITISGWPCATILAIDGLLCVTFHVAFLVADRRFANARKTDGNGNGSNSNHER
jgi:cytochrome c biogenesis factor